MNGEVLMAYNVVSVIDVFPGGATHLERCDMNGTGLAYGTQVKGEG